MLGAELAVSAWSLVSVLQMLRNLDYREILFEGVSARIPCEILFGLIEVEKLTNLISIGGVFNVSSFSNRLEARVLRHSMYMFVSLLIDASLFKIRALRPLAWCVHQLSSHI